MGLIVTERPLFVVRSGERSMTDSQGQRESISEDEELDVVDEMDLVDVPKELVARIDEALLALAKPSFQKVARLVMLAMKSIRDAPETVTDIFYAKRIMHLVQTGQMESKGDLRRMRFSEVRLPSRPLSTTELEELIAQGDYWTLGCLYSDGQGVTQDYVAALRWYRIAAERGEVWSQFNVGRFYMNGYGVEKEYKEAYFWFSLAVNGSSDKRPIGYWLKQVAPKLTPEERAEVDKQVAEWRPTIGFTA
jgi:hypothetical protein